MKSDSHEPIRAVVAIWFTAMEAADVELALSVVADDVIQVSPGGACRVGHTQLREALVAFHEAYAERVQWSVENITISGQHAEVRINEMATIRPRAGSGSYRVKGHHIARLTRTSEGSWLIAEDIAYMDGEPAAIPHEFELDSG